LIRCPYHCINCHIPTKHNYSCAIPESVKDFNITIFRNKLRWAFVVIGMIGITAYYFKLDALVWYFWHSYKTITPDSGHLDLKNYQVEIDALPIPDIKNASALTYNPNRNSLFTVLNKESLIIELDTKGTVIRKIDVTGVSDMEGIAYIKDNRYVIADEGDNRLIEVVIDDNAAHIDATNAPRIRLGINHASNKDFEGVHWDEAENRLLVVKESNPKFVMSVKGFFNAPPGQPADIEIKRLYHFEDSVRWSMRDLSSVTYYAPMKHLLLLSDQSRMIKEYNENSEAVGALALWKGFHGLSQDVPQAEGIEIGSDKRIYVISEPNLFYVFNHKAVKH